MLTPQTLIGRVLGGQYRIDALLGQGGFGAVFRAWDLQLDRAVAVKVIAHAATATLAVRFRREAQVQARLRHPAIVRLLHFGEDDGLCYMVQEYVDGRTLRAAVDHDGPLDADRAVAIFSEILDALDDAHAEGIVHRDLKPENIMLVTGRRGEEPRLLDFGIAKLIADSEALQSLTASGALIGTPAYLSPEQAHREPVTPASDIYSLGCVMHYALTGQKPFVGTPVQVIMDHVRRAPPPLPAHLPPAVTATVRRAMSKQPVDRYGSAIAMKTALAGHGAPITGPPPAAEPTGPANFTSTPGTISTPGSTSLPGTVALTALDPTPLELSDVRLEPRRPPRRRPWRALAAALVAVGALGAWLYAASTPTGRGGDPAATAQPPERLSIGAAPAPLDAAPPPADAARPAAPPDAAPPDAALPDAAPDAARPIARRTPARKRPRSIEQVAVRRRAGSRARPEPTDPATPAPRPEPTDPPAPAARPEPAPPPAARPDPARQLDRDLTAALHACRCDAATEALVDRLRREHALDRRDAYLRHCKIPGLPTSCIGR